MHAQLMGAARACVSRTTVNRATAFRQRIPSGLGLPAALSTTRLVYTTEVWLTGNRLVDHALILLEFAPARPPDTPFRSRAQTAFPSGHRGGLVFRDDDQAGWFRGRGGDHARRGHTMLAQPVRERAVLGSLRRMADHPARLSTTSTSSSSEDDLGRGIRERVHGAC